MTPIYVQPPNKPNKREHIGNWTGDDPLPSVGFVAHLLRVSSDRILTLRLAKERKEPIIVVVAI